MNTIDVKLQLFEKMKQKRGKHGQYAIEMLETADQLLMQAEPYPQHVGVVAYCIRQAVTEIFGDEKDNRKKFKDAISAVINARHRVKPEESQQDYQQPIQDVISAVDDLEHFESEPKYKARLTQIFRREAKIDPTSGDYSLPNTYQQLIDDLNCALHDVVIERGDRDKVRRLYTKAIDILTIVFLPSVRLREIDDLAQLRKPRKDDARRLSEIMINAYGFDRFAGKMVSSDWFDLMDPDMLKSASDGQPWLLRYLAIHRKGEHTDKFVYFVEKNFKQWVKEDTGLAELGYVGERLESAGLPLLTKALRKSESIRQQCNRELTARSETKRSDPRRVKTLKVLDSIKKLEHSAFNAYQAAEPSNPWLIELADRLLDFCVSISKDFQTTIIPVKLVESMDSVSAACIINILTYKIWAWLKSNEIFYIPELASITDIDPNSDIGMNPMVGSLCSALAKARDLGLTTSQLIEILSNIPDGESASRQYVRLDYIKYRLIAWLYSGAADVDHAELVDFVVESCGDRLPTGDDELLLEKLGRGDLDRNAVERIHNRIREAPDHEKMDGNPRQWNLSEEEVWRILWAHILHCRIEMPSGWEPCIKKWNPLIAKDRRIADEWKSDHFSSQDSPVGPEILSNEDPRAVVAKIAAWDIKTLGLPGHVSVYDLVHKLTSAVTHNASKWAEDPVEIIKALRHPVYVAGYFNGLANSVKELRTYTGRLISAVRFVRTHPWDVVILELMPFGYDVGWEGADTAGIELIKAMAEKNIPLDDELCGIWELLYEAVANQPTEFPENTVEHLRSAADYKHHTRALTVLIHLIGYAVDRKKDIPENVLMILTDSIKRTGRTGKEFRVVFGEWIKRLRTALPRWFEQHEQLLLGNEVSDELGQITLDMHILSGKWDEFVLEKYRDNVLDAVKRDAPMAMECLLKCMLWGLAGYEPKLVAKSLNNIEPERVSKAGELSAWLLNRYKDIISADHIRRGTEFWEGVLDLKPEPVALVGFGRWATVSGISQSKWERTTLSTCDLLVKKPDSAREIAKRISSAKEVTETGLKILVLLMRMDLGHETYPVAEHVLESLNKSKDSLGTREIWTDLYEIMQWQGFT